MLRNFSTYIKYFYLVVLIMLLFLKKFITIDSSLIYIFSFACIVLLFIVDLYQERKRNKKTNYLVNIIEEMAKGNMSTNISIGANTKKNLDRIEENLTQLIKTYYQNNYDLKVIKEKQKHMLSKYKEIAIFFITDDSGQQIHNSLGGNLVSNSDREYFKNAKKTGKTQISDIVVSKLTGKLAIIIAVPYFRENEFMGIFATTIDMQSVSTSEEKLENALLGTIENLRRLIRYLQYSGQQVASSAEALSATSQQSVSASENVATSSYEVTKSAEEQANEVLSTTAAMQQMAASIQEILGNAEEINHLSQQASKSALTGEEEVKNAMESMDDLEKSSDDMQLALDGINNSSSKMDEIIQAIESIADQTNLLALNASIEAARAGEAGKGFAVVADEIRKLAESTKSATMEINNLIQEIQYKLNETNRVIKADSENVQTGIKTVNSAGKALNDIINFVNTMSHQVDSITKAINEVAQVSQGVVSSTNVIQQRSKNISDEIQNVSAAAEEQTAAMEEIASASESLTELSRELQERANEFKV
ncbi:TPA: methyl-accepting chemotaxis protein [Clostridioides difficile]|jgi:methyl-accepting chemotaxis protein